MPEPDWSLPWKENKGRKPRRPKGEKEDRPLRCRVILAGDHEPEYASDTNPNAATAWAVDTTNWSLEHPVPSVRVTHYILLR